MRGSAFHKARCTLGVSMIDSTIGPSRMRSVSVSNTLPLTIHARPVRPMCKLCTSCFQVATMNPASISSTTVAARGVPMASCMRRTRSVTMGQVPDHSSASGSATSTTSHAASVLHSAIFSLAAMSSALVNGRVAMNGGTP